MHPVDKYLSRYAEPEASQHNIEGRFDHVLVIPACAESAEQLLNVWREVKGNYLVIVVVNCPDSGTDAATERLAADLAQANRANLVIVDRYSRGRRIPIRQGVGLARKIGCDLALSLIHRGIIDDPWVFTSDADVRLPANYFELPASVRESSAAALFPFHHVTTPELDRACRAYELSMLYYAAGLRWAGSSYAYTTIGSTIAFSADCYAGVRGFPKRNTGEDFYLLNKLRKSGPVSCLTRPTIEIEGRLSERVPIGTGRAIARLSQASEARIEHPKCFELLRATLSWMRDIAAAQPRDPATGDPRVDDILEDSGFFQHFETKRTQSPAASVMQKHLEDWFDGLKTRQFIHRLRDQHFGEVPIHETGKIPFASEADNPTKLLEACRKQVFTA